MLAHGPLARRHPHPWVLSRKTSLPALYQDAERIGIFWHELGGPTGQRLPVLNPNDLWDFREWSDAFEAFTYGGGRELIVGQGDDVRITEVGFVEAGFFEFFGYQPVHGRTIVRSDDVPEAPLVVVLSHRVWLDRFGGDPSVVGTTLTARNSYEIVGVVRHLNLHDIARPVLTQQYFPMRFGGRFSGADHFSVVVRAEGPPQGLAVATRRAVEAMGSGIALQDMEPIEEAVARGRTTARISFVLMVIFGVAALALASIGLYGVLALAVTDRTKEIGIRIALGQHPASVLRLIVRQGMRLVLVSVALGLAGTTLVVGRASGLLFGVGTFDALAYVSATVVLIGCALFAIWIPARRAMRVDPIEALRVE